MNDPQAITGPLLSSSRGGDNSIASTLWCLIAAFGTYFCMYGFRKPFTAASYDDYTFFEVGYKTILVTSQVLGYTLSKFIGIKLVAEMKPERRAVSILGLIVLSWVALLFFGMVPPPINLFFLFLNGVPLGMVFGLVLGFLEGRQLTEALTAGLCASFILAGGVTKTVGAQILVWGVSPYWMPAVAGFIFAVPLVFFVWMLTRIPPPTDADRDARSERTPMTGTERRGFFRRYAVGLTLLTTAYLLITILRSIRDDFAPEIFKGLGVEKEPSVFALTDFWVALGVTFLNGLTVLIGNNRRAFTFAVTIAIAGLLLVHVSLWLLNTGSLTPIAFMILIGLGLYVPYVAVHTTIFERLIAMTRDRGNIGYLMYLVDAFGYLGYVAVMLVKNFWTVPGGMLNFFKTSSWIAATAGIACFTLTWTYFAKHKLPRQTIQKPLSEIG